jgi:hypothetical protein
MDYNEKPKSRLGCVPPGKYKRQEGHVFTGRKRTIDRVTQQPSEWIIFCVWCGARKKK